MLPVPVFLRKQTEIPSCAETRRLSILLFSPYSLLSLSLSCSFPLSLLPSCPRLSTNVCISTAKKVKGTRTPILPTYRACCFSESRRMLRIFVGSASWRKEIAWQLQPVRFDVQRVCSDINPGISTRDRYSPHSTSRWARCCIALCQWCNFFWHASW